MVFLKSKTMKQSKFFKKFKDNSISDLTKISGGSSDPGTQAKFGSAHADVHSTSPQTPGQDDWANPDNKTCNSTDIVYQPASPIEINYDDDTNRATFQNVVAIISSVSAQIS